MGTRTSRQRARVAAEEPAPTEPHSKRRHRAPHRESRRTPDAARLKNKQAPSAPIDMPGPATTSTTTIGMSDRSCSFSSAPAVWGQDATDEQPVTVVLDSPSHVINGSAGTHMSAFAPSATSLSHDLHFSPPHDKSVAPLASSSTTSSEDLPDGLWGSASMSQFAPTLDLAQPSLLRSDAISVGSSFLTSRQPSARAAAQRSACVEVLVSPRSAGLVQTPSWQVQRMHDKGFIVFASPQTPSLLPGNAGASQASPA